MSDFLIIFIFVFAGLLRLQDLVRAPPTSKMEVYIRQGTVNTYRQVLREIKQRDINNIIVDTRTEHVHTFFRAVRLNYRKKSLSFWTSGAILYRPNKNGLLLV